jgi:regulator of CtrA degradation
MIIEARDYLANYIIRIQLGERRLRLAGQSGIHFAREAFRLTTRLTEVMAWLMLQRAVHNGEITSEEACQEHNRLSSQEVCFDTKGADEFPLPDGLCSILGRSHQLYGRISRLEQMVLARVLGTLEDIRSNYPASIE